jgi:hypothetical protein
MHQPQHLAPDHLAKELHLRHSSPVDGLFHALPKWPVIRDLEGNFSQRWLASVVCVNSRVAVP